MSKLKLGHIVYTASDKCVLDIGWVESVNPLIIQSRVTKYDSATSPCRYGGVQYVHWIDTNKSVTAEQWRILSYEKTTQEICNEIGVSYYMNNTQKSKVSKPQKQWYCIEYRDTDYYAYIVVYKVLATDAKQALYSFYARNGSDDPIIEKAIMAQDDIEGAIELLNKLLHLCCGEILNIFTIGNWVYCTEVKED